MALLQSQQALLEEQCRIEMQNDQISQGGNGPATSAGFNTAPASMFLRLQRWIFLAPPAKPDMHQFRSNLSFFMLNVMRMMAAIEKVL